MVPLGTYDRRAFVDLGTNRWGVRTGVPMVVPIGNPLGTDGRDPALGRGRPPEREAERAYPPPDEPSGTHATQVLPRARVVNLEALT
jgi:hypothetical protein